MGLWDFDYAMWIRTGSLYFHSYFSTAIYVKCLFPELRMLINFYCMKV